MIHHKYIEKTEYYVTLDGSPTYDTLVLVFNKDRSYFFKSKIMYYYRIINRTFHVINRTTHEYEILSLDEIIGFDEVKFTLTLDKEDSEMYDVRMVYIMNGETYKTL